MRLGQSGIIVDGTRTARLAPDPDQGQGTLVLTAGGQTLIASVIHGTANAFMIGDSTISLDGPAVTFSGHTYSIGKSGMVVDESTAVPTALVAADNQGVVITAAGLTYNAFAEKIGSVTGVVVDGVTLLPDSVGANTESQSFSLGSDGVILDGTSTIAMPGLVQKPTPTLFVVHSKTYTAYALPGTSSAVVVDGVTLSAGHDEATVAGETFSLRPSGLVIDGSSTVVVPGLDPEAMPTVFEVNSHTFTALAVPGTLGDVVVNGLSLIHI